MQTTRHSFVPMSLYLTHATKHFCSPMVLTHTTRHGSVFYAFDCLAGHSCVPMCLTHATTVFPLRKITDDFDPYNQKQFRFLCPWVWSSQPDTVLTSNSLPLLHQAGHSSVYCLWPIQTDTVHFPAPVQKTTLITILFSISCSLPDRHSSLSYVLDLSSKTQFFGFASYVLPKSNHTQPSPYGYWTSLTFAMSEVVDIVTIILGSIRPNENATTNFFVVLYNAEKAGTSFVHHLVTCSTDTVGYH